MSAQSCYTFDSRRRRRGPAPLIDAVQTGGNNFNGVWDVRHGRTTLAVSSNSAPLSHLKPEDQDYRHRQRHQGGKDLIHLLLEPAPLAVGRLHPGIAIFILATRDSCAFRFATDHSGQRHFMCLSSR
jgi:hypothetical protein